MAALLGAAIVLSGCQLTFALDVEMGVDGASVVRLTVHADEELAAEIDLSQVVVDDLDDDGWSVFGPRRSDDGGAELIFEASGLAPDQLAQAIESLDGAEMFEVRRAEAIAAVGVTDYALEIAVLPGLSVDEFSDDELRSILDGRSFGFERAELEARAGQSLEDQVFVTASVSVPGPDEVVVDTALTSLSAVAPDVASVASQVRDDRVTVARDAAVVARDDVDDAWRRLALFWVAAAVLGVVTVVGTRQWRRRDREPQLPTL